MRGLEELHKFKIAHLDLKLKNIFSNQAIDEIVLADFGIAKLIKDSLTFKTQHAGQSWRYSPLE